MTEPDPTRKMLEQVADSLAGQRVYGGCEHCDAYQQLWKDPKHPGIFHIGVFHDDWCPEHGDAASEDRRS